MLFSIWGEKSNPAIQGLHTCWAVGLAIGPLVIRPFLGPDLASITLTNTTSAEPPIQKDTAIDISSKLNPAESHIEIAYAIIAALTFLSAVGACMSHCFGAPKGLVLHTKHVKSIKELLPCRSQPVQKSGFTTFIQISFCLFYFWNIGIGNAVGTWLFTFAVKGGLDFSKQDAALLDSAAKSSYLCGRILATLFSLKMSVQTMLFTEVSCQT
jgi:hypothetical protein